MVICTRVALLCLATLESASFIMLIKQYLTWIIHGVAVKVAESHIVAVF